MVDDSNNKKEQAKQLVIHYLSHLPEAKKALEEVKKTTDLKQKLEKAKSAHTKHSTKCQSAIGYYNSYNLAGEVNSSDLNEYDKIVKELYKIEQETEQSLRPAQPTPSTSTNLSTSEQNELSQLINERNQLVKKQKEEENRLNHLINKLNSNIL